MKLYARTPAGIGLAIRIHLTGQVKEFGGKIRDVQVILPSGCDNVVGYAVAPLPKTPAGDQLLWADPGDLCADDGTTLNQGQLRAEVERVNNLRAEDARRGPLGENWP